MVTYFLAYVLYVEYVDVDIFTNLSYQILGARYDQICIIQLD